METLIVKREVFFYSRCPVSPPIVSVIGGLGKLAKGRSRLGRVGGRIHRAAESAVDLFFSSVRGPAPNLDGVCFPRLVFEDAVFAKVPYTVRVESRGWGLCRCYAWGG